MTVITKIKCYRCGKIQEVSHSVLEYPKLCHSCIKRENEEMILEEKLKRIGERHRHMGIDNIPIGEIK